MLSEIVDVFVRLANDDLVISASNCDANHARSHAPEPFIASGFVGSEKYLDELARKTFMKKSTPSGVKLLSETCTFVAGISETAVPS